MPEFIRQDTEYAMRALVYLALKGNAKHVAAKELAKGQDIPEDFAYKILHKLTRAGLTKCHMGHNGGFKLARIPEEITFLQVVTAIQGPVMIKKCCFDLKSCPRGSICGFSAKLMELQDNLVRSFNGITLADVVKQESII
jgi:Rrf2 family transcriptional regulator, iron-sulfur cluster assembly transcription factor